MLDGIRRVLIRNRRRDLARQFGKQFAFRLERCVLVLPPGVVRLHLGITGLDVFIRRAVLAELARPCRIHTVRSRCVLAGLILRGLLVEVFARPRRLRLADATLDGLNGPHHGIARPRVPGSKVGLRLVEDVRRRALRLRNSGVQVDDAGSDRQIDRLRFMPGADARLHRRCVVQTLTRASAGAE